MKTIASLGLVWTLLVSSIRAAEIPPNTMGDIGANPFDCQVAEQVRKLNAKSATVRAGAAEALTYYRAYSAADALARALRDVSPLVRREAAMSLAWCGGRSEIDPLLDALEDRDWVVRQAAWVSLTNLTGMEWPFDALADRETRDSQVSAWKRWWTQAPTDRTLVEVVALVESAELESRLRGVRALGGLGGEGDVARVMRVFDSLCRREYRDLDALERHVGQSCIRSLGRLRDPGTLPVLIKLLESPGWARYAADALGDFGSRDAVGALIAAYPKFSRHLDNRTRNPELCPADDRYSGDNTQDRMPSSSSRGTTTTAAISMGRPE